MNDNLFDRLFELFQTSDTVNWGLAEEIVKSAAGPREPIEPQLAEEYQELALAAQLQLSSAKVLDASAAVIPDPVDSAGWAIANFRSFSYLMEPLSRALGGETTATSDPIGSMMGSFGSALTGLQAGSMTAVISRRTMGQFDTILPSVNQSKAYLVVPNIEDFASSNKLDPRQVRLWATMHELVRHAVLHLQATQDALSSAVAEFVATIDFDPSRLMNKLGEMRDPAGIEAMLGGQDGLTALLGSEGEPANAARLETLISFLNGYGDYIVNIAGEKLLPDIASISTAYKNHRTASLPELEQIQQSLFIDITRSHPEDGESFCEEVSRRWGLETLVHIWENTHHLPAPGELADPVGWAARTLLD